MDDFDTRVQCEEVYGFDEAEAMREVRAAELEEQIRASRYARHTAHFGQLGKEG